MSEPKTLVVIPTYNEIENIEAILKAVLTAAPTVDILVADDNSPDGTGAAVEALQKTNPRILLLKRAGKEGLAAAYLAAFRWGMNQGYEWLIQMDADFSHYPTDVPRMIEALHNNDLVIASRYTKGGFTSGWSALRKFISRGGNVYASTILRTPVKDMTGGFNAWRASLLEKIKFETVRSRGYSYQVEMKYRALKAGARITEIPIHFRNRTLGQSKMSGSIVGEAAYRVLQLRTT